MLQHMEKDPQKKIFNILYGTKDEKDSLKNSATTIVECGRNLDEIYFFYDMGGFGKSNLYSSQREVLIRERDRLINDVFLSSENSFVILSTHILLIFSNYSSHFFHIWCIPH